MVLEHTNNKASHIFRGGRIFKRGKHVLTSAAVTGSVIASAVGRKLARARYGLLLWAGIGMSGQITEVSAQNVTFDNDAGTGIWGTAINWDTDQVPAAGDNAFIGGAFDVTGSLTDDIRNLNYSSTGTSMVTADGFGITGVLTNSSTGSIDFSGNTGGATNTGAGTITIGGGVTGRVISTGTGAIDIAGQLRANGGGVRIDIDDGDVSAGSLLNQNGSDALITGGSLTSTGSLLNFNRGTVLRVSSGGTLNANSGITNRFQARLQVDNGGVINVTGNIANGAGRNQQGSVLITGGTLNADSFSNSISSSWTQTGGVVNISGNANISASAMRIQGGEFNVENITRSVFNSISFSGTSVTNVRGRIRGLGGGSRGSISVAGSAIVNVGSISNERGNTWNQSGGVVTVNGSTRNTNTSFNISGGEHHANGGFVTTTAVTVSNTGFLDIGSSGMNINAGGNAQGVARLTIRNDAVVVSSSVNNVKGVVSVSNNASLTTTTGRYTNQANGALNVSGGMVEAQSGLSNSGTVNLSGTGEIQVTGGLNNSRNFNVTSATSTLTADTLSNSRLFNLDAGIVNVTGNATILTGNGQLDQDGGTFNVGGLLTTTGGGIINLDDGVLNANGDMLNDGITNLQGTGDLNLTGDLDNGGTFNVLGGLDALDIENLTSSGLFNLDTNTVNVSGTASIEDGGELDQDGGTFNVTGLLSTAGTGTINLDDGVLNANGDMLNDGITNLQGTGDLNLTGDLDNGGTFNVLGGLDALDIENLTSSGLFNLDTNTVNVSGTASIEDGGELDQDGGTFNVTGLLSTAGTGTINLDDGVLNANGDMLNDGITNLQGTGDLNLTGDLDNGGTFNVLGGLDALDIENLTSSGLFNLDTNTVNVSGTASIEDGGELDQDGGTFNVTGLLSTAGTGTINLDAGVLNANGDMLNNGITTIDGTGDFNLSGHLDNGGTFNVLGGAAPAQIESFTNSGTMTVAAGAGISDVSTARVFAGATLDLEGALTFTPGDDTFDVAGILTGAGTIDMLDGDDMLTFTGSADLSGLTGLVDGGAGMDDNVLFDGWDGTVDGSAFQNWEAITVVDGAVEFGSTLTVASGPGHGMIAGAGGVISNWGDFDLTGDLVTLAGGRYQNTSGSVSMINVIGSIRNAGAIDLRDNVTGDVLMVSGDYSGDGALQLDADATADFADTLVIAGDVVAGGTTIFVADISSGEASGNDILLVDVQGATSEGDFQLVGDTVDLGGVAYELALVGSQWFLQRQFLPSNLIYEAYPQNLNALNTLEGHSQRVQGRSWLAGGDPLCNDAIQPEIRQDSRDCVEAGLWMKVSGGRSDLDLNTSTTALELGISDSEYDISTFKFEMGVDTLLGEYGSGRLVGGFRAFYGSASLSGSSSIGGGSADSDAVGVGTTLTWYDASGLYVDAQLQYADFESDLSFDGESLVEDNSGSGYAASLEIGKTFALSDAFSITPEIQYMYYDVDFDSFTGSSGEIVSLEDGSTSELRVGGVLEYQSPDRGDAQSSVYLSANVFHLFDATTAVRSDDTTLIQESRPWRGEIGLGGSYEWNSANGARSAIFAEMTAGSVLGTSLSSGKTLGGSFGVKIEF